MVAVLDAYRHGLLNYKYWSRNIIAGMIVGFLSVPISMAFASASGAQPEQGLYTAMIGSFCVAVLGGTRVQISVPSGVYTSILAWVAMKHGIIGIQLVSMMSGCILVILGSLNLGRFITIIPGTVIQGLSSAVGVMVLFNQAKDFFGIAVYYPPGITFWNKCWLLFSRSDTLSLTVTIFSLTSLSLLLIIKKTTPKLPAPLITIFCMSALQAWLNLDEIVTLYQVFGGIPRGLPEFQSPLKWISLQMMFELIQPACVLAIICGLQSLITAATIEAYAGYRHKPNQELIGQGIANFLAPCWGGFVSTGATSWTMMSVQHGGNTPLAAIVHSLSIAMVLLCFSSQISAIPFCVLSAILSVIAVNLINYPLLKSFYLLARRRDLMVIGFTFALTLSIDLFWVIGLGTFFSFALDKFLDQDLKVTRP